VPALRELPEGTFGKEYTKFLDKNVSNIMHVYLYTFFAGNQKKFAVFCEKPEQGLCSLGRVAMWLGHQGKCFEQ
jgi:hypothetical protein